MTVTITDGASTVAPITATGYQTAQQSQNVFHDIIGRGDPDVSLAPAKLRAGRMETLFATPEDAAAACVVLAQPSVFTYTDTDLPTADMRFAVDGEVALVLEEETRQLCLVTFGYRELS